MRTKIENNFSNIKQRIVYIAEYKGLNKEKFFQEIGMTSANFRGAAQITPINSKTIENIFTMYPEINLEWLLTGKGEMFKKDQLLDLSLKTDNKRLEEQTIPLYSFEAAAGLVQLFNEKEEKIGEIYVPKMPKCDGAVHIVGDSMYPLLKSGDIVMYKKTELESIFLGEMYLLSLLIGDELFTLVKYINKSDMGKDYVKLVSYNEHHSPKDVPLKDILKIALIKGSIRFNSMA